MSRGLTTQYLEMFDELSQNHSLCVILFQKGRFYEIYALPKNSEWFSRVCNILNLNQTRCNTNLPLSDKNPLFAGFPTSSVNRHLKTLTENGYTVQIVDETKTPTGITRNITRTINSATFIDEVTTETSYFLYALKYDNEVAYTIVNLQLSEIIIVPETDFILSRFNDLLNLYKFGEIVFQTNSPEGIPKNVITKIINKVELFPVSYQETFLRKIYKPILGTTVIDYLKLSKYQLATVCLINTIDYLHKYDNLLLKNIRIPKILKNENILYLSDNTINQLNLNEVIKEVDNTSTPMGKRLLKTCILNPKCHNIKQTVETRDIRGDLKRIGDLEKLTVKLSSNKIQISEIHSILQYIKTSKTIYEKLELETKNISKIIKYLESRINTDSTDESTFFKEMSDFTEYNQIVSRIKSVWNELEKMAHKIHPQLKVYRSSLGNIYFLTDDPNVKAAISRDVAITKIQQGWKVISKELETSKLTEEYNLLLDEFDTVFKQTFTDFVNTFSNKYNDYLHKICNKIAEIDINVSNAILIRDYGYHFADFKKDDNKIIVSGLIHPISKKLDTGFIPFNFTLNNGILLYGVNFSGKSTLLRCLGIAVILAQAGIPSPVSSLVYKPFTKLFTKIALQDNYLKGQSLFTNEILEVKNIIDNCDENSLILADELYNSTEITSSLGLIASTIVSITSKSSKFIFTTHYHELPDIPEVKESGVEIYHIKVTQTDKNTFIYDRQLQPGKSIDLYGIEIARFMNLNSQFINLANKIRNDITGNNILKNKTSRYNSDIFINDCFICGEKKDLHTHHIKFQSVVKNKTKNYKGNLMVLCSKCHDDVHYGSLNISGLTVDSTGSILLN